MYVAVVGPGTATAEEMAAAEEIGRGLAREGAVLICGGLAGVMEAACRGAFQADGTTVGILPGSDRSAANPYLTVAIATGLGELRNGLIVRAADVLIGVGGANHSHGTLAELALALKAGKPVIGLGTWKIEGVQAVDSPQAAVELAIRART